MKMYKIYESSQGHYKAVKQGWSWPAFGFSCLWAIANRVWRMSTVSLSIFVVLGFLSFMIIAVTPEVATRLSIDLLFIYTGYLLLGVRLLLGLHGNQWYEKTLAIRGYHYQEMVVAHNVKTAIELYIKQNHNNDLLIA